MKFTTFPLKQERNMKSRFPIVIVAICSLSIALSSCKSCNKDKDNLGEELVIPDSLKWDTPLPMGKPIVDELMQNISSPVETAALIKGLKIPFNKDYMASTKQEESFNTSFDKALALGIYGCDLGYLNMYEKTSFVVDYISVIKRFADDIQVGQFFDFETLKRLATNKENLDSLILISQQSFNRIDSYLRETNRSTLSAVIVAGVWVEGAYLTSRVAQTSNHPRIRETIGEQKTVLGFLLALLKAYSNDPNMAKLIAQLEPLKNQFDNVKITYELGEPEMIEVNGELTFIQKDKQLVDMDDVTYKEIISGIQTLRNSLIKL